MFFERRREDEKKRRGGKKMMNEEESRLQHIKDANKHLKELDTMKSNISGGKMDWNNIVEIKNY